MYEPLTPANECAPVADLIVENVRPKSVTVSIAITAMPERYRGGSPTPTPEETPSVDTPVRTFSDTFQLEAYPTEDVAAHRSAEYSSVPGETGWHRLEVDVKYGPEEAFSFQPPYGDESGYKVTIHAGDGLKEGKVTSRCDH